MRVICGFVSSFIFDLLKKPRTEDTVSTGFEKEPQFPN